MSQLDATIPPHEVIAVPSDDEELTKQCQAVRIKVFVDEQKFPLYTEIDQYDEPGVSMHFLVRLLPSREPVGVVRLVLAKGKVGRLCVLSDYRKYGFGRALMLECREYVSSAGVLSELNLHSQIPVIPFYARLGYVPVGEEFDEDGAPHQKMVLSLKPAATGI